MVERELIAKITIPKYIREIEVSQAIRPKYWECKAGTIKSGSRKLLQKYISKYCKDAIIRNNGKVLPQHLKDTYKVMGFKGKKLYCELSHNNIPINFISLTASQMKAKTRFFVCTYEKTETEIIYTPVIANEKKVGKPNVQVINGQNIYNHTASPFTTGKIFDAIKKMYYRKFKTIPKGTLNNLREKIKNKYPLMIEVELGDTVKNSYDNTKEGNGRIWDVGNRTDPYMKTFLDFITKGYTTSHGIYLMTPIIEEDDRLHVTTGNNSFFTPVEDYDDRYLTFYIYQDKREIFKQYLNN